MLTKEELIELNGKEYTVTLNRETFIKIDQLVNVDECTSLLNSGMSLYSRIENPDDDYDPYAESIDFDMLDERAEQYSKKIENFFVYGFHVLLYPKHHFKISEVREMLKLYLDDEKKGEILGKKYGELLAKCILMKLEYDEERKNLKAQANKK